MLVLGTARTSPPQTSRVLGQAICIVEKTLLVPDRIDLQSTVSAFAQAEITGLSF